MHLVLRVHDLTIIDLWLWQRDEPEPEPRDVHDLGTQHERGEWRPLGWTE